LDAAPLVPRVHLRELGPEEQDLRRVVDPQQDRRKRSGGAEHLRRAALDVEREGDLADLEQHGRQRRAEPHVPPLDLRVGQQPKDHREQHRHHAERDDVRDDAGDHHVSR
jgi:hypothetical protein